MDSHPRSGTRIRVNRGFDNARTGVYIGKTPEGLMILNMDLYDLLPDNDPLKQELVSPDEDYEILN